MAEQRKQTVHKARPMPKYTRLKVCDSYSWSRPIDILYVVGGVEPEEGDHGHLPIFAHQEECQGAKMTCFKILEIEISCLSKTCVKCRIGVLCNSGIFFWNDCSEKAPLDIFRYFHVPTIGVGFVVRLSKIMSGDSTLHALLYLILPTAPDYSD